MPRAIYYCGHGDISRAVGEYRVFLRNSRRDRRHGTMLDVIGLIRDVERILAHKAIFFVLDACYSGSVIRQEFMDAAGAEALRLAKAEEAERIRLAQIATDRKALDAAGTNLGQLRTFVQQCAANSCTAALEARDRLAKAGEAERARLAQIAADRVALNIRNRALDPRTANSP